MFSVNKLPESFNNSAEETRKAPDYFLEEVKKACLPGSHIQWNMAGGSILSKESAAKFVSNVNVMGFRSVAGMSGLKAA